MNQTIGGGVSPFTLDFIKQLEGYTPQPKWDYKQYSTGYGTRWNPGDPIGTRADHEAALSREAGKVNQWLDQNVTAPLQPNQRAALTSAGFNLGTGEKGLARLLDDINAGNWDSVARRLPTFNKAGGEVNEGLINRRAAEVEMLTGRKPSAYIGGTAEAPAQTGGQPMPPQQALVPPSGRYSKLADMLLASGAGAKPTGWGSLLNAGGDLALGYSLSNKDEQAQNQYRSKLAEALGGAGDRESLMNTLMQSGDPDLMKTAISEKLRPEEKPTPTSSMREYEFAKGQGYEGSFTDYQTDMKKAGASSVNVDTKGETKYSEKRGEALAEEFGNVMKTAGEARSRINQLQSIDQLLSDPNVYTGTGAEKINAVKRLGKSLFGLDFEGVGPADAASRVVTTMALSYKDDLPGPMSNADREFLQAIPPSISDTAEGRKLLVQLEIAKERRKIDIAALARQYRAEKGQIDDGWYDALEQWSEANPLVTPQMMEAAKGIASQTPQPSPTAGFPTIQHNGKTYYEAPDGQFIEAD